MATALITVTPAAGEKVRKLAAKEGNPDAALRVRVLAGGCSGFRYALSFEAAPSDDDVVIEESGIRVLVDPASAPILRGSTLDFDPALLGGGLKVRNPQAVRECGCGESFAIS